MICPKCNSENAADYAFCLQCGATLATVAGASPESTPTVILPSSRSERTEVLPANEVPPTVQYAGPRNTQEQQTPPTVASVVPPTVLAIPDRTVAPAQPPAAQASAVAPNVSLPSAETVPAKPKRSRKALLIALVVLLLLLVGGGLAVYFRAQPMQADKSYVLTDKRELQDKVLSFDSQSDAFTVVGKEKDGFERWQIVPDPSDKNFYRFTNRGLGPGRSLEVVDDNYDSSVGMARSARDIGQLWAITNVQGDYYRITSKWLGDSKSLAHFKRSYYFLRLRDINTDDSQLWKKVPSGDGKSFYLVNKRYGDQLTLEAYSTGPYADKLELTAMNSLSPDTRWVEKDLGNGTVNLTTSRYEMGGASKLMGANPNKNELAGMAATGNLPGQTWKFVPVGGDYFRLINGNNRALEALTFVKYTLEMVKSSDGDPAQLWQLTKTNL